MAKATMTFIRSARSIVSIMASPPDLRDYSAESARALFRDRYAIDERMLTELYPRLLSLTLLARQYDIGLNIDAEEADRLEISLDLLERLCFEPALAGWNGVGFVIQAY